MATIITKPGNTKKKYTVRYQHNGRQRERSFAVKKGPAGAEAFAAKFEHDSRAQIFVDPSRAAVPFATAAENWVASLTGKPSTAIVYRRTLRLYVNPAIGTMTLAQVAADRDGIRKLLNVTLPAADLSQSVIHTAYIVIRAVVADAVKSGTLGQTRLSGIALPDEETRAEFVFASHAQLAIVAKRMGEVHGALVWLMRGCGLRIGEALAVGPACILPGGVLRVSEQLLATGEYGPLKHRKAGQFRDVPMPLYVVEALSKLPARDDGHWFSEASRTAAVRWFRDGCRLAGLADEFVSRHLRHTFASVALANSVPITDVSKWLGHQSINTTYAIYGHLVPSSWERARLALDTEYETWASAA